MNETGGGYYDAWNSQVTCYATCCGAGSSKAHGVCPEGTEFYPAVSGHSGFGKDVPDWSIMDRVVVPDDLEEGDYLLSWRWDCEESTQVWQNCADLKLSKTDGELWKERAWGNETRWVNTEANKMKA